MLGSPFVNSPSKANSETKDPKNDLRRGSSFGALGFSVARGNSGSLSMHGVKRPTLMNQPNNSNTSEGTSAFTGPLGSPTHDQGVRFTAPPPAFELKTFDFNNLRGLHSTLSTAAKEDTKETPQISTTENNEYMKRIAELESLLKETREERDEFRKAYEKSLETITELQMLLNGSDKFQHVPLVAPKLKSPPKKATKNQSRSQSTPKGKKTPKSTPKATPKNSKVDQKNKNSTLSTPKSKQSAKKSETTSKNSPTKNISRPQSASSTFRKKRPISEEEKYKDFEYSSTVEYELLMGAALMNNTQKHATYLTPKTSNSPSVLSFTTQTPRFSEPPESRTSKNGESPRSLLSIGSLPSRPSMSPTTPRSLVASLSIQSPQNH